MDTVALYAALKAELLSDPNGVGYSGMTDAQAATSLTTPNITVWIDTPTATVKAYLIGNNLWRPLQASSVTQAQQMVDTLNAFETIQLSSATYLAWVQSALAALVTAGLLSSAQETAILSFGQQQISRAQQIGWVGPLSAADVHAARAS